jgi:hypothetical protein
MTTKDIMRKAQVVKSLQGAIVLLEAPLVGREGIEGAGLGAKSP